MAGFVYSRKKSYAETLENCISSMISLGIPLDEATNLCHKIDEVFDEWAIEEVFKPLGFGAFKEAYLLNDNFVIKFCSMSNNTKEEINILQSAYKCGIDQFFLPTHFIPLPLKQKIILNTLSEDNYDSYYGENRIEYADYIIIQPRATIAADLPCILYRLTDYSHYTLFHPETGKTISREKLTGICIESLSWMQDALDIYGYNQFDALISFIREYELFDLHLGNIGYYQGKPILLDWLSYKE